MIETCRKLVKPQPKGRQSFQGDFRNAPDIASCWALRSEYKSEYQTIPEIREKSPRELLLNFDESTPKTRESLFEQLEEMPPAEVVLDALSLGDLQSISIARQTMSSIGIAAWDAWDELAGRFDPNIAAFVPEILQTKIIDSETDRREAVGILKSIASHHSQLVRSEILENIHEIEDEEIQMIVLNEFKSDPDPDLLSQSEELRDQIG